MFVGRASFHNAVLAGITCYFIIETRHTSICINFSVHYSLLATCISSDFYTFAWVWFSLLAMKGPSWSLAVPQLFYLIQVLSRAFPANNVLLSRLKDNLSSFQSLRWDHYWKLHVLPLIASLDRGQWFLLYVWLWEEEWVSLLSMQPASSALLCIVQLG